MFYNNRKTIGLFVFNTISEYQTKICNGVTKRAKELGYNVAVFSSYGDYGENPLYSKGETGIFDLPPYEELAGAILAMDTFTIQSASEMILTSLKERAHCPIVSLRKKAEGASNLLIDNNTSMEGIIRHLVEEHKLRDIAFMAGPKTSQDSELRLACFRRLMKEYNIDYDEHRLFHGDLWVGKGQEAVDWFFDSDKRPEAIVCCNDYMAMAVVDELNKRNIKVPDEIVVTGYDGIESALVYSPSITTVSVDFDYAALRAVDLIDKHQDDDEVEDEYIPAVVEKRESCGCLDDNHATTIYYRCLNHRKVSLGDNTEMQFSFMNIKFGEVDCVDQMQNVIKDHIYNIDGFNHYCICLRDDIEDEIQNLKGYTDTMNARVIFKDRVNLGVVTSPFDRKELIPKELGSSEPQCFLFSPLHFFDQCYGYEAFNFQDGSDCGQLYIRWSLAIDNAITNIIVKNKMKRAIDELENMYIQDVLTGLYNRRGFEKYGRMQFIKARAQDKIICVIGIDMDGLKPINDIYGHHEGDLALRSVGYAIQEAACAGQIGARIGGDEFEVIFPCTDEKEVERWVKTFEKSLDKYNKKSLKPYKVYASLGYKVGIPGPGDTIESYMKESDDMMYKNKVINKTKRNESLR